MSGADIPLTDVLVQIDAWYLANVPAIHAGLHPGCGDAELDALERWTGLELPEAFRALYRWHDGQNWSVGGVFGLDFMPLEAVTARWDIWTSIAQDQGQGDEASTFESFPAGATQTVYGAFGWLPFLGDGGGNFVGLDFNPGPAGTVGQVITFGRDETEHYVLADSLDEFLREYEARLDDGLFIVGHPDGDDSWEVELLDLAGQGGFGLYSIASVFPDFGAAPDDRCPRP